MSDYVKCSSLGKCDYVAIISENIRIRGDFEEWMNNSIAEIERLNNTIKELESNSDNIKISKLEKENEFLKSQFEKYRKKEIMENIHKFECELIGSLSFAKFALGFKENGEKYYKGSESHWQFFKSHLPLYLSLPNKLFAVVKSVEFGGYEDSLIFSSTSLADAKQKLRDLKIERELSLNEIRDRKCNDGIGLAISKADYSFTFNTSYRIVTIKKLDFNKLQEVSDWTMLQGGRLSDLKSRATLPTIQ